MGARGGCAFGRRRRRAFFSVAPFDVCLPQSKAKRRYVAGGDKAASAGGHGRADGRADARADARTLRQAVPVLSCCAPPGVYDGATRLRHLAVGCHHARVAAASVVLQPHDPPHGARNRSPLEARRRARVGYLRDRLARLAVACRCAHLDTNKQTMQRLAPTHARLPSGAAKLEGADRRSEWSRHARARDGLQGCEEG